MLLKISVFLLILNLLLTAGCASSRPTGDRPATASSSIAVPSSRWTKHEQAVHVLNRLAYGPSPEDLNAVERMGVAAWIESQLHPDLIEDDAVASKLSSFPTLRHPTSELLAQYPPPDEQLKRVSAESSSQIPKEDLPRQVLVELAGAKLVRAIESKRQLQEVLVDFWFNHFNVSADKGQVKWMVTSYERDAIRPHVFGTFRELLSATAHHPAMLFYLDNWMSTQKGLNENYGRELLELHTLGVNGGYTQKDVRETARCFTGWSVDAPKVSGTFAYRPGTHDKGEKTVVGFRVAPGGGQDDGERVLDFLASHPSTARFISTKLVRKFVSDDPPPILVNRVAEVFLRTGGDLPSVYAAIFSSPEFWLAKAHASKVKTPLEFVASAVRALGGTASGDFALAQQIDRLGEPLYRCQPPTGFAESSQAWVNSGALVNRINFGLALAANRIPGVTVDTSRFVGADSASKPDAVVASLANAILGTMPSSPTLETVRRAILESTGDAAHGQRRPPDPKMVAGLLLGSPEFQKQ